MQVVADVVETAGCVVEAATADSVAAEAVAETEAVTEASPCTDVNAPGELVSGACELLDTDSETGTDVTGDAVGLEPTDTGADAEAPEVAVVGSAGVADEVSTTEVGEAVPKIEVSVEISDAELALKVATLAVVEAWTLLELELDVEPVVPAGQVKLNNGVVDSVVPTRPKLGLGVVGYAS